MSLILSLIIGVAAFNIVASLVMVVTDKTTDIAVLRTLGMGPNGVVRVFFVQGAIIGWAGVLIGVMLGVVLAILCARDRAVSRAAVWLPDHARRRLLRDANSVRTGSAGCHRHSSMQPSC